MIEIINGLLSKVELDFLKTECINFKEELFQIYSVQNKKHLTQSSLDNYISNTFALLRDKRLYGSTSNYGLTNDDMNTLIPKIKTTIEIIINNNYLTQIKDRTNIAKKIKKVRYVQ
jgi:hypothetical protein